MLDTSRAGKKMRDPRLHATLATFHRPGSRESEAYRSVRAALFFGAKAQDRRVLQITSPNPGDGKSTLAANLAVAIASSGKKCLLIDADFRRPKVHRLFTLSNEKGVSSVIERETEILDAVQPSPINNLDIISAGPQSRNPAELILSPKFAEMLTLLKERYDFVLIDSPPILAVSDPSALAAYVDGVLLVVQITKRVRPLVRRSKETLDLIGARLIGVVVNGVGGETGSYGYNSGSYGYGYGYGNAGGGYSDNGTGSEYFNNAIPDDATAETVEGRS